MRNGKVELYINEAVRGKGAMLFTLIDPVDYDTPAIAIKTASECARAGVDAILLGGSVGAQGELLDEVAKSIKEKIDVPLILFPGNIATITRHADAILYMSLMNSRNPYWLVQAHMLATPLIRKAGIEPLPTGYILVTPGGTAGWVGDVNLIPREKPQLAAALALTGEYLGHRLIFTDTGSNPRKQGYGPIPPEIVKAVKSAISVPYMVGGGIRTTDELRATYQAGADIVVIGTAFEDHGAEVFKKASSYVKVTKEEGAKRLKKM